MYLPHFFISLLINLLNLINWFSEFLLPKCKVVSPYILLTKNKSTLKNDMSCLWNKNQDVLFLCVLLQYLNYRGTSWILQIYYRRPFFLFSIIHFCELRKFTDRMPIVWIVYWESCLILRLYLSNVSDWVCLTMMHYLILVLSREINA